MNLPELLKKAQQGRLVPSELEYVVKQLSSGGGDLYTLLHILGRAGSPEYRELVEPYLHFENDPQLAALVLKILCRWWGPSAVYRNELLFFLKGASWDAEDYVRLEAISLAGDYMREHPTDNEILDVIYRIFSNESERRLVRTAAYFALCRSEGMEWSNLPPASRIIDFSKDIDPELVTKIARRLGDRIH